MFESWILLVDKVHPQDMQAIMAVLILATMFLVLFLVLVALVMSSAEKKVQRNITELETLQDRMLAELDSVQRLVLTSNGVVNATQNALQERTEGVKHGD